MGPYPEAMSAVSFFEKTVSGAIRPGMHHVPINDRIYTLAQAMLAFTANRFWCSGIASGGIFV